jgi:hypothetical protein
MDVGFSGQLWTEDWAKKKGKKSLGHIIKSAWASLEVFNILGINNTVSYLWVRDIYNNQYGVPNFLSNRRINGRIIINF